MCEEKSWSLVPKFYSHFLPLHPYHQPNPKFLFHSPLKIQPCHSENDNSGERQEGCTEPWCQVLGPSCNFHRLLKTKITQELNIKCPFESRYGLDFLSKLMQEYFKDGQTAIFFYICLRNCSTVLTETSEIANSDMHLSRFHFKSPKAGGCSYRNCLSHLE